MQINAHVREAVLAQPEAAWTLAIDANGQVRHGARVCELTGWVDLHTWPAGTRAICRREDAHPGAQLRFTDHDGHRFQGLPHRPARPRPGLFGATPPAARPRRGPHPRRQATGLGQPLPFDRGSGATAAGGGVQRADRGDLIREEVVTSTCRGVDRTQHRPCEQPASVHMGSTPWIPRSAACSVHRCRPSTEAHGAYLDQLTTPPREPLGPMAPCGQRRPPGVPAGGRTRQPPPTPSPKQQQQHDGHRPEREAPADFLANRDMSRNGLGFAVSLRQEPPRLVDLEGANGLPE